MSSKLTLCPILEPIAQTEPVTRAHAQEILSLPPTASAAGSTATNNALEFGAIAAMPMGNVARDHRSVAMVSANLAIAQSQKHPRVHRLAIRLMALVVEVILTPVMWLSEIAVTKMACAAHCRRIVEQDGKSWPSVSSSMTLIVRQNLKLITPAASLNMGTVVPCRRNLPRVQPRQVLLPVLQRPQL